MSALNLDRSIFNVYCQFKSGIEALTDPATTRAEVIDNIVHGELGFERRDVVAIVECNPIEGWSRIVTDEILAEVDALCDDDDRPLTGQDAIEAGWDHARGLRVS